MKREINEFCNFIKKSKYSIGIIIVFTLLAFGQRLTSDSFSIDTEHYIYNIIKGTTVNWDWWISLNRWGLVLINKIFQINSFPIFISNYITIILMICYSISFNYLFYKNIKEDYKEKFIKYQFIFNMIFLTNPIFAEQYNFIHQNVGVAFGILLIPIALLLIEKAIISEKKFEKLLYYIIAISISVLAFGVYQSIILLYIVTVASCYLLKTIKDNDNNWNYIIKHIIIFGISALGYIVVSKIIGEQSGYLQMAWIKESPVTCIRNILYCVKDMIKCTTIFFNIGYVVSIVLVIIGAIYGFINKKVKIGTIIAIIGILLAPFYIMIITGVDQLKRTQFNYPYVIGFILMLSTMFLANKESIKNKILKWIILIISLLITYVQAYNSSNLFYTSDVVYKNDINVANKLIETIEEKEWYNPQNKYTLIFVGKHSCDSKNIYIKGEIIGSSFFDFDYENIWGVNERANVFLTILGHEFNIPTVEQFEKAKNYVKENEISIWPKEESIILTNNNEIIVKLSEI